MNRLGLAAPALVALLALGCAGCGETISDAYVIKNDPGHVEPIEGRDEGLVTLTAAAAERLQIRTVAVVRTGARLVVPEEAVFVDTAGDWWVFTSPEENAFVREAISIVDQQDGKALLETGPAPGTKVVVVGVAELSGVENAVGH